MSPVSNGLKHAATYRGITIEYDSLHQRTVFSVPDLREPCGSSVKMATNQSLSMLVMAASRDLDEKRKENIALERQLEHEKSVNEELRATLIKATWHLLENEDNPFT